jgi:hypothetical protein
MSYRKLPLFRRLACREKIPESAYIVPDRRRLALSGLLSVTLTGLRWERHRTGASIAPALYMVDRLRSIRLPVNQPLSHNACQREFGARNVIEAGLDSMRIAEIELGKVAVKVFFAAMLVDAFHTALENRVIAFDGVRIYLPTRRAVRVSIFLAGVIHYAVRGKLFADALVSASLVGHQMAFAVNVRVVDRDNLLFGYIVNVEGTRRPAALNEGKDGVLMANPPALGFNARLPTDVGLVNLYRPALAAHGSKATCTHGFADAMTDEPACLEVNTENAAELICAKSFFAAAEQVHCLEPDVHRDVAFFEDGSDLHGERLTAGVALVGPNPSALAFESAALVDNPTMRADDRFSR